MRGLKELVQAFSKLKAFDLRAMIAATHNENKQCPREAKSRFSSAGGDLPKSPLTDSRNENQPDPADLASP